MWKFVMAFGGMAAAGVLFGTLACGQGKPERTSATAWDITGAGRGAAKTTKSQADSDQELLVLHEQNERARLLAQVNARERTRELAQAETPLVPSVPPPPKPDVKSVKSAPVGAKRTLTTQERLNRGIKVSALRGYLATARSSGVLSSRKLTPPQRPVATRLATLRWTMLPSSAVSVGRIVMSFETAEGGEL